MNKTIREIATITSGIYTKPGFDGEVYYLQASHFNKQHQFDFTVKPNLILTDSIRKHLLKCGDIIVAAKGTDNFAVVCKGKLEYSVASTIFMVVKIFEPEKVLPEYLAWFINHPHTQQHLQNSSKGSSFPSITKNDIEEIIFPIPSIIKQRYIINIDELFKKQLQIKKRILTLKEKLFQQQLLNSLK
ncbi:MAG TPA: restriction endonuclease subunit S [Bacteroidales bacterium]|nr:restriction endonuclease subunit S [Bacteroidales bacterium]